MKQTLRLLLLVALAACSSTQAPTATIEEETVNTIDVPSTPHSVVDAATTARPRFLNSYADW